MKRSTRLAGGLWAVVLVGFSFVGGCTQTARQWWKTDLYRFLSPDKVIRPPEGSPVMPIFESIGPTDRSQEIIPNATFPNTDDLEYAEKDYIIGPTDIVDVSILDLFAEGLETVLRRQVSETGYIDLPLLPEQIKAERLTKEQLREAIKDAYSPDILRDPTVSVTIAARRNDTFSILGAVSRPGTYNVLRPDMRLLEALALAGGVSQTNIRYIYVIRPMPAIRRTEGGKAVTPTGPGGLPKLPPLPPEVPPTVPTTPTGTAPATGTAETETEAALRKLGEALKGPATEPAGPETQPAPAAFRLSEGATANGGATTGPSPDPDLTKAMKMEKWEFVNGKWVPVATEGPTTRPAPATREAAPAPAPAPPAPHTAARPPEKRDQADPFGWRKVDKSDLARIIAINLRQLRDGDPRMNIVLRNNDIVHVPTLEVGEFYIMGEVIRPGVYSLTGRQITVKMAVAAAGNLTGLAWPDNSILIRRIGDNQEQVIPLNLESIFQGQDPDYFLKPNDVIAVGTDVRATFFAVMRNAFRMTYGFGFIYDRNFQDPILRTPTGKRFTRW